MPDPIREDDPLTIAECLRDLRAWMDHAINYGPNKTQGHSDNSGHPHTWNALLVPDWQMKQKLDNVTAALALPDKPHEQIILSLSAPYSALLEKLREPVDEGGFDGRHVDPLHVSAANAIDELLIGLASQIDICNTLRRDAARLPACPECRANGGSCAVHGGEQ